MENLNTVVLNNIQTFQIERTGRSGFNSSSTRNVGQKRSQDRSVQSGAGDPGKKSTKSKKASHVKETEEEQ